MSQQCHAFKSYTTRRCKNKTKRGDFCTAHQGRDLKVKVKKSGIREAGLGLFTTVARKKDEKIVDYKGVVTSHNPDNDSAYVIQVTKNKFIDAENPLHSGYGRYANDARPADLPLKNNTKFSYNPTQQKCVLKAAKPIKANSEVLVPYGRSYWK
jgi:hypothetical protein